MLPAIVRLIMSKGAQEAIKKYGTKAVREAQKHIKDLTTKPTPGQKKIAPVTKSQRAARSSARKGALSAGAVGAAGAAGYKAGQTSKDNSKRKGKVSSKTAKMLNTSYRGKEMSRTDLNKRNKK